MELIIKLSARYVMLVLIAGGTCFPFILTKIIQRLYHFVPQDHAKFHMRHLLSIFQNNTFLKSHESAYRSDSL